MDWNAAIEKNREALKRVLAMLVAMAALPVLRACGDAGGFVDSRGRRRPPHPAASSPPRGAAPAASGRSWSKNRKLNQ